MKKIIVSLLLLLPLGLMAQELKIAIVKYNELILSHPDFDNFENEMAKVRSQYEQQAKVMDDEFQKKYADFTSQADSLTENIKIMRMQEIENLRERIETFIPNAEAELSKTQEQLITPIYEKIQNAINSVGEENGYTYIVNPQAFHYIGSNAVDVTNLVKAKLGIK